MKHRDAHVDPELIAAWSLGELSESEDARVRSHVDHCGRCQAEADLARDHFRTPRDARIHERSEDLVAKFEARLATDTRARGSAATRRSAGRSGWGSRRRLSWVLAAAAVAFAILGLNQIHSLDQPPTPSDQFLSTSSRTEDRVHIEKQTDGWVVRSTPVADAGPLRLTIQNDRGDVLYEAASSDGIWRLRVSDLGGQEDGDLYFARVSAVEANGRRWVSDPELLP